MLLNVPIAGIPILPMLDFPKGAINFETVSIMTIFFLENGKIRFFFYWSKDGKHR